MKNRYSLTKVGEELVKAILFGVFYSGWILFSVYVAVILDNVWSPVVGGVLGLIPLIVLLYLDLRGKKILNKRLLGNSMNREEAIEELGQRLPEGDWELLTIRRSDGEIAKVVIKRVIDDKKKYRKRNWNNSIVCYIVSIHLFFYT